MVERHETNTGYVYFLMNRTNTYYKIGHTRYLMARVREIGAQADYSSSFFLTCNASDRRIIESELHHALRNHRRNQTGDGYSEWFLARSITDALDMAEVISVVFERCSQPTALPSFGSIEDIGQALAENGAAGTHDRLGRIALSIGQKTRPQLQTELIAVRRSFDRLDLSCPHQIEVAEFEADREQRILEQMNFEPFITPAIRVMARLHYTLKRPAFERHESEDLFNDAD